MITNNSRLTASNKELQSSYSEMEVKSKLSNSQVYPLVHENQRLKAEVDSVMTHNKWLEEELKRRTDEWAELKTTHSQEMAMKQNELDRLKQSSELQTVRIMSLETSEKSLQTTVDQLSKKLLDEKKEHVDTKTIYEQELQSKQRLVNLQTEELDRLKKKHDDVIQEMNALKAKAREAQEESNRERQQLVEKANENINKALEEQAAKYESTIEELNKQVGDAKRRRLELEDSFLASPTPAGISTTTTPTTTTTTPLALTAGEDDEEPIGLTDMAARLAEAKSQVVVERTKRRKAEIRIERIQAEIQAKVPVMNRQRQEYEFAMKRQEEYQNRLDHALEEATECRGESRDLRIQLSRLQKQNKLLEQESRDLANQVQALLISKAGGTPSGDIPLSIQEIHSQNQRLLKDQRRLKSVIKELEERLNSDSLENKLELKEKELETLRADRQQQERLVSSIVQQRDLYRALLSKHDSKLLSEDEEITALELTKRQSDQMKTLQDKNLELETNLVSAKSDVDRAVREKEAAAERLSRSEILVMNLTSNVDALQKEVSIANADAARAKAENKFHSERASRMEESLRHARDEVTQVTNAKTELQRINSELQNSVAVVETNNSRLERDLKQVRKMFFVI